MSLNQEILSRRFMRQWFRHGRSLPLVFWDVCNRNHQFVKGQTPIPRDPLTRDACSCEALHMNDLSRNSSGNANSKTAALVGPNGWIALNKWLDHIGVSATTGWRWRKRGWLHVVNIAGRMYLTRAALTEFEQRAQAGEFSRRSTPTQRRDNSK
jgi:hypothetical protein